MFLPHLGQFKKKSNNKINKQPTKKYKLKKIPKNKKNRKTKELMTHKSYGARKVSLTPFKKFSNSKLLHPTKFRSNEKCPKFQNELFFKKIKDFQG